MLWLSLHSREGNDAPPYRDRDTSPRGCGLSYCQRAESAVDTESQCGGRERVELFHFGRLARATARAWAKPESNFSAHTDPDSGQWHTGLSRREARAPIGGCPRRRSRRLELRPAAAFRTVAV